MEDNSAPPGKRPPRAPPESSESREEGLKRASEGDYDTTRQQKTVEKEKSEPATTNRQKGAIAEPGPEPAPTRDGADAFSFKDEFMGLQGILGQMREPDEEENETVDNTLQMMFSSVFIQQENKELPEDKAHYPMLQEEEIKALRQLFQIVIVQHDGSSQQWQRILRELTTTIYKSRTSLMEAIALKVNKVKMQHVQTENPWTRNPLLDITSDPSDVNMEEDKPKTIRFKTDVYSTEEIAAMRELYETPYDFPTETRAPTAVEKKFTQGLLEGTILAQQLPQFLKRSTDNKMLRMSQNTIHAQVEGELMFQLPDDFPVYPNFQTRDRLRNAMLMGAGRRGFDMKQLTQMLGETKQVCYNAQQHSVHLIYWTREAANKWAEVYKSITFRNRRFLLVNVHPAEITEDGSAAEQAARVWGRQVGRDGVLNARQHDRYKIKLLNVSRFIDEPGLDAFLRSKFTEEFTTFQEPSWGNQACQTGVWGIYFRSSGCPEFLDGIRFINWMGTKILVHHAGINPAPPCYNCGRPGHTVVQCRASSDQWKSRGSCISVTANDVKTLEKDPATVTSFEELEQMWEELQLKKSSYDSAGGKESSTEIDGGEEQNIAQPATEEENNWFSPPTRGRRRTTHRQTSSIISQANGREETDGIESSKPKNQGRSNAEGSQSDNDEPKASDTTKLEPRNITRPKALSKQQRLIMEAIGRKNPRPTWENTKQLQYLDITDLNLSKKMGQRILESCGLYPITTPGTGNCQYYAISMALLDENFSTTSGATAIEHLTAKLKKGLQLALSHGFDEEILHLERIKYLTQWQVIDGKVSEEESKTKLLEHMEDICSSSSKKTSFIAGRLWGSDLTLRMAAKLLQRPIFVVVAQGSDKPSFQVFEPSVVKNKEFTLETAKEYNFDGTTPELWVNRLQEECKSPRGREHLPIVLKYGGKHYTWLKFGKVTESEKAIDDDEHDMEYEDDGDDNLPNFAIGCPPQNVAFGCPPRIYFS